MSPPQPPPASSTGEALGQSHPRLLWLGVSGDGASRDGVGGKQVMLGGASIDPGIQRKASAARWTRSITESPGSEPCSWHRAGDRPVMGPRRGCNPSHGHDAALSVCNASNRGKKGLGWVLAPL